MSDDRYGAHPDDYDDGSSHSPELDAARKPSGYNEPASYAVPESVGYGSSSGPEAYYPPAAGAQPYGSGSSAMSKLAVAGFIVSIVSLLLNFLGLTALVGIVLSIVGLTRDVNKRGARGKGFAIAGIIIGVISLLLVVFAIIAALAYFNSGQCVTSGSTIRCNSNFNSGNL